MRHHLILVGALALISAFAAPMTTGAAERKQPCPPAEQGAEFSIEASVSTAGPYGQLWSVKLDKKSEAAVEIHSMLTPMGELKGSFLLDPSRVAEIAAAAKDAKFLSLPNDISPAGGIRLHAPDLRIRIRSEGRTHQVRLYDPAAVSDVEQVRRFMSVWDALFTLLPFKPVWQ